MTISAALNEILRKTGLSDAQLRGAGVNIANQPPPPVMVPAASPQSKTLAIAHVADLARVKRLPLEFLHDLGLKDVANGVSIEYRLMDGSLAPRQRIRCSPPGKKNFSVWDKNSGPIVPYGLDRLRQGYDAGFLVLVEGESDSWTLWHHGYPAMGIPGATMASTLQPEYLNDEIAKVYVVQEPGDAGKTFVEQLTARLRDPAFGWKGEIAVVSLGATKDPSDLHIKDSAGFNKAFQTALDSAVVVDRTAQAKPVTASNATANSPEWPKPSPLGDDLPPVDSLALELLPQSLRPLVEDASDRMQTPPDFAAIAGIVALAGCVNRRALIRPKAADNWLVTPNLWGAIIAPPGFMKSPILHAMTAPLAHIEETWRAEHESAAGDFAIEKEKADLRFQAWRECYKAAHKKNEDAPTQPDNTLKEPTLRRLLLTDTTFEALHAILADNPAGVLVTRDELTGWISTLDRPGREGERGFFLQSWNGDSGFTIDRVGRGSIHVPAVCVSLLGCIQPARLRWYLSQSLDGGPSDDGLLQRFQLATWPDAPRGWKLIDRTPNNSAIATAEKVLTVLANLSPDSPIQLHFDPEAQQLFFAWWGELERKIRGETGLHPALVAHLAKYRSLLPTLAGLFELADCAAESRDVSNINLIHTRQAAAWCEYLESHAKRIYSCVTSPDVHAARLLAGHIEREDLEETFSTREIYAAHHWSSLDTPERVRGALGVLADGSWVRAVEQKSAFGRPSELWQVNPKVVRHAQ